MTAATPAPEPRKKPKLNDVIFTITSHGVRGDKETKVTLKKFLFGMCIFIALFVGYLELMDIGVRQSREEVRQATEEKMIPLADQGADLAALWLIENAYRNNTHRLPALVEKGYPEAQFMKGVLEIYTAGGNEAEGWKLIKRSAAQGYKKAVSYLENHPDK